MQYDAVGRLELVTFPDGTSEATSHDAAGQPVVRTNLRGYQTSYEYDAAGRMTTVTTPLGDVLQNQYDAAGNQTGETDPKGNFWAAEYDAKGRKTKTIFPDGTFKSTTYDALGRKTAETDQAGLATYFDYDALGRLTTVTDAMGGITSYTYDEVGNKLTQTDANNNTTSWTYDDAGRMTSRTLPMGQVETYGYDANGNLTSKIDFNGFEISYAYDVSNRLISKTYPDSSSVTYTYTLSGQRETVTDSSGTTSYAYDDRNRLVAQTNPDLSFLSYTYDEAGNRTSLTTPNGTATYTFDELNRLNTVTDSSLSTTSYAYDANGKRASVSYPNGTTSFYTYDSLNRLTYMENVRSNNTIISSYSYTLGLSGNRTQVVEHNGRTVDYVYDDRYRLTQESIQDPINGSKTFTYAYDAVGNRLTKTEDGMPTNYVYDANDRLISEDGIAYGWDENGNRITKTDASGTTTYTYNYENRMIAATTPTSAINYEYDADGIRISQDVDGAITNYLVDKAMQHAQVVEETDNMGGLAASYVHGDDLVSQERSGVVSYYHYDGLGSVRVLTDDIETVTDTYTFDAFGTMLAATGTTVNSHLFTGEQYDPNVGFYYLRARWMNPETGRFTRMDDYWGGEYDPVSLHKYMYANANPVNMVDPSGQFSMLTDTIIATSIVTALSSSIAMPYYNRSYAYIRGKGSRTNHFDLDFNLGFVGSLNFLSAGYVKAMIEELPPTYGSPTPPYEKETYHVILYGIGASWPSYDWTLFVSGFGLIGDFKTSGNRFLSQFSGIGGVYSPLSGTVTIPMFFIGGTVGYPFILMPEGTWISGMAVAFGAGGGGGGSPGMNIACVSTAFYMAAWY